LINIGQLLMHSRQPQWKKGSAHKEHYPFKVLPQVWEASGRRTVNQVRA
jgi:hypothetical protein